MKLKNINRLLIGGLFGVLANSSGAQADSIIMDNLSNGDYGYVGHGRSVDSYGGSSYDISKMKISRTGEFGRYMQVQIYTNFAGKSGDLSRRIQYGDLLLSTSWNPAGGAEHRSDNLATSGTRWEYAYALNDRRDYRDDGGNGRLYRLNSSSSGVSQSLYERQFYKSNDWYSNGRRGHAVTIKRRGATALGNETRWDVTSDHLTFNFDLWGTNLLSSSQIAFHWAMTCANDVLEGQVSYGDGGGAGDVSEPNVPAILLLGFGALYFRKKLKKLH